MKVIVRFHDSVRARVIAWRDSLSENHEDAVLLAATFVDHLKERLVASDSAPADAVRYESSSLASFWCEVCGGTWVRCKVVAETRRLWWVRSRTIEINALQAEPPAGSRPSFPRN